MATSLESVSRRDVASAWTGSGPDAAASLSRTRTHYSSCGRGLRSQRVDPSSGLCPLRARVGMEIPPVGGRRDVARADHEVAEALALVALLRVGREQRVEPGNDVVVLQVLGVELGHARAVECGA